MEEAGSNWGDIEMRREKHQDSIIDFVVILMEDLSGLLNRKKDSKAAVAADQEAAARKFATSWTKPAV